MFSMFSNTIKSFHEVFLLKKKPLEKEKKKKTGKEFSEREVAKQAELLICVVAKLAK